MIRTSGVLLAMIGLFCLTSAVQAVEYAITVPATSNAVLAAVRGQDIGSIPVWVKTNVVRQGETVKAVKTVLFAVTAGTTGTNQPTNTSGTINDGTVKWVVIPLSSRLPNYPRITQENNGTVWYFRNKSLVSTNGGEFSSLSGQQFKDPNGGNSGVFVQTGESQIKFNITDE